MDKCHYTRENINHVGIAASNEYITSFNLLAMIFAFGSM